MVETGIREGQRVEVGMLEAGRRQAGLADARCRFREGSGGDIHAGEPGAGAVADQPDGMPTDAAARFEDRAAGRARRCRGGATPPACRPGPAGGGSPRPGSRGRRLVRPCCPLRWCGFGFAMAHDAPLSAPYGTTGSVRRAPAFGAGTGTAASSGPPSAASKASRNCGNFRSFSIFRPKMSFT